MSLLVHQHLCGLHAWNWLKHAVTRLERVFFCNVSSCLLFCSDTLRKQDLSGMTIRLAPLNIPACFQVPASLSSCMYCNTYAHTVCTCRGILWCPVHTCEICKSLHIFRSSAKMVEWTDWPSEAMQTLHLFTWLTWSACLMWWACQTVMWPH